MEHAITAHEFDLTLEQDRDYVTEKVVIPRKYHRVLLGEKGVFMHDIESKTNCKFRYPDRESASDVISVFGPESQVHIAATMLLVRTCPFIFVFIFADSVVGSRSFRS